MEHIGHEWTRRPPGSYSKERFAKAFGPVWRALGLHPASHYNTLRAQHICERFYKVLCPIVPFDDLPELAEWLADLHLSGHNILANEDFLPLHDEKAMSRNAVRWRRATRENLRKLGYQVR